MKSTLTLHPTDGLQPTSAPITEPGDIASTLTDIGVRYERWQTKRLADKADQNAILNAYDREIASLKAAGGYQSADVVRLKPNAPNREEMRSKFLDEHTHSEDEVRFFVEGSGAFFLRSDRIVYRLVCTEGDLISVPAGLRHWFDMGPLPDFTAVRLFTNPEGWVAKFTGDTIAQRIPLYDQNAA